MKLVVFGDSFVSGLYHDENNTRIEDNRNSFAYHLVQESEKFTKVQNFGYSGACNAAIGYSAYCYAQQASPDDFVLVVWSGIARKRFFKHYDDIDDINNFVRWYNLVHQELEGIPHAFTSSFVPYSEFVEELPNYIGSGFPHNTLFDIAIGKFGRGYPLTDPFLEHAHRDLCAEYSMLAPCLHPNPKGHKVIAKTLESYL